MDKPCARCGAMMVGASKQRRYCPDCVKARDAEKHRARYQARRLVIHCALCGAEIEAKVTNQKYCTACAILVHHERTNEANRKKKAKAPSTLVCRKCGRKVVRESPSQRYCPDCRESATRETQKAAERHARGAYTRREANDMLYRRKLTPQSAAAKINARARAEGMSYGQYVALMNERGERA